MKFDLGKALAVLGTVETVVSTAKAVNSTAEYKGKDKVENALKRADTAIATARLVSQLLKK